MLLVKNTSIKPMGFGSFILAPDAVGELPGGYGLKHPAVSFYLEKGWLTQVERAEEQPTAETPPPGLPAEETAAKKKAETAAKIGALDRMNLEELRKEATAVGVEWVDGDTKKVIAQKITEKLQAEAR